MFPGSLYIAALYVNTSLIDVIHLASYLKFFFLI